MNKALLTALLALGFGASAGGIGYVVTNNYNQANIKNLNTQIEQKETINSENEENISILTELINELKSDNQTKQQQIDNLNKQLENPPKSEFEQAMAEKYMVVAIDVHDASGNVDTTSIIINQESQESDETFLKFFKPYDTFHDGLTNEDIEIYYYKFYLPDGSEFDPADFVFTPGAYLHLSANENNVCKLTLMCLPGYSYDCLISREDIGNLNLVIKDYIDTQTGVNCQLMGFMVNLQSGTPQSVVMHEMQSLNSCLNQITEGNGYKTGTINAVYVDGDGNYVYAGNPSITDFSRYSEVVD